MRAIVVRMQQSAGADPGFLERGFICIKVWRFAWLILSKKKLNNPCKLNNSVSLRPNYLIFIGYLKTDSGEGVRATS